MIQFYSGFGIDRFHCIYKTEQCFCMKADLCLAKVAILSIPNEDIIFICLIQNLAWPSFSSSGHSTLTSSLFWPARFYNLAFDEKLMTFLMFVKRSIIYFLCMVMCFLHQTPTYGWSLTSVLTQINYKPWVINIKMLIGYCILYKVPNTITTCTNKLMIYLLTYVNLIQMSLTSQRRYIKYMYKVLAYVSELLCCFRFHTKGVY